jgi:DNA-binding protein Fis
MQVRKVDDVPERILAFEATEDEVIAWYMRGVLERAHGNQCEAQRVLHIDRSTIRRRIEKLGLRRRTKRKER